MTKKKLPWAGFVERASNAFEEYKQSIEETATDLTTDWIAKAVTATANKEKHPLQGDEAAKAFCIRCAMEIKSSLMPEQDDVYFAHLQGKDEEKIRNAIQAYAKLEENENVILVYDSTIFGSSEEGVALTTKRVFVCEGERTQSVRYRYLKGVSCTSNGKSVEMVRANGGTVSLGDLGSKKRAQQIREAILLMREIVQKRSSQGPVVEREAGSAQQETSNAKLSPVASEQTNCHPVQETLPSYGSEKKPLETCSAPDQLGDVEAYQEEAQMTADTAEHQIETIRPEALRSFQASAAEGAALARAVLERLERIADQTGERLQTALQSSKQAYQKDDPLWDSIEQECRRLSDYGKQEIARIRKDIDNRAEKMGEFTITVFGKTTVGKSTLMETLRHGDGASIGKGGQRTTQDVRRYPWRGLAIYDVPGVEAFGGEADTEAAFKAARNGDVILFLMNDNALQQGEAECLARLCAFGKPVLGVLNVRMKTTFSLPLLRRRMEARFASQDLKDIIRQAQEYGRNFGQDWSRIHFIPAHLKCAFEAQRTEDAEKREAFAELSHFDEITDTLSRYVMTQGAVLRWRSFVDIVYSSMYQLLIDMKAYREKNEAFAQHLTEVTGSIARDIETALEDCERGRQSLDVKMKQDLEEFRRVFTEDFAESGDAQEYFRTQLEARQQTYQQECEAFVARVNTQMQNVQQKLQDELRTAYRYRASEFHVEGMDLAYEKHSTFWSERLADIAPALSLGATVAMKTANVAATAHPAVKAVTFVAPLALDPLVRFGAKKWKASTKERNRKRLQKELEEKLPQFLEDFECALDDALETPLGELRQIHEELVDLPQIFRVMERDQQQMMVTLQGIRSELDQRILERIAEQELPQVVRIDRKLHDAVVIHLKQGTTLSAELCERLEQELQEHVQTKMEGDN